MTRTQARMVAGGLGLLSLPLLFAGLAQGQVTGTMGFADPAFQAVWNRTDLPVANHTTVRTWYWGPAPNSPGLIEPNAESPGGVRLVQYFDKSRMEINNPTANRNDQFFVTNGLLTVELISGRMQVGASQYVTRTAACIPATGDPGDTTAPTYAGLQMVSNTTLGDHFAPDRTGQVVTATISRDGTVGTDPAMGVMTNTRGAYFDPTTKHNVPEVFWNFLNQSGPIVENGQPTTGRLNNPWFYASGLPISEAYWTKATIQGRMTNVLIQMYERRALTYVPTNVPGFQVEMANIGQHYYDWRYRGAGSCSGTPGPTFQPTQAALTPGATGTAMTSTPGATSTAVTGTAVTSPEPTGTIVIATGTVVRATPLPTGSPNPCLECRTPTPGGTPAGTPVP
ncbi:MAG TPA: hypothetical protein VM536_08695 [Chloroflexia bacterium]|nr:hypothetical protein [Chloroflexia bacterium]